MGEGTLMVWLEVGYEGRISPVFFSGGQKHTDYIFKYSVWFRIKRREWMYEKHETSIHIDNGVKNWFAANNMQV